MAQPNGAVLDVIASTWTTAAIAVTSTSSTPCGMSEITVTLKPSTVVDITCVPSLNISGLKGSTTASGAGAVNFTASSTRQDIFGTGATFERISGTLTVTLRKNVGAEEDISFTLSLQNQPQQQSGQSIKLQSPGLFADTDMTGTDIMKIDALIFSATGAEQST
jgi:hypothetical protein